MIEGQSYKNSMTGIKAAPPPAFQHTSSTYPECQCLEKLRLLVAQELDGLRGAFRAKEA